jgi:hypothetical protein
MGRNITTGTLSPLTLASSGLWSLDSYLIFTNLFMSLFFPFITLSSFIRVRVVVGRGYCDLRFDVVNRSHRRSCILNLFLSEL